jgi:outer membrane protein assembly factor BamA
MLQFPGARKAFTYTRLLQVVNLPDQEVYGKDQIPQAASALENFLHTNGFFQAKVNPDTQLDEPHQLANINFNIKLGKRAHIGNVNLQGGSPEENARLMHSMRTLRALMTHAALKPGKTYTVERLNAALSLLKKRLAKEKRLADRVNVNPTQYHPENNHADISIIVTPGPVVSVRTTGARLSNFPFVGGRRKKKLIPIYEEGAIDRDLVNEGQRNLINFFQEKGYFDVQVKTIFKRTPEQISLVYDINKSPKHRVDDISFQGNRDLTDDELRAGLAIAPHHFLSRGSFSDTLLRKSVNNIEAIYRNAGFEEAKVTPEVVDNEPDIDISFQIFEGPRTVVKSMKVEGNTSIPLNELTPTNGFQVRPGAPFSPKRLSDDRSQILAVYLNRGYLNAEVNGNISRHTDDPHQVDIAYAVVEHQQVRLCDVVFLGQKVTRKSLLSKMVDIAPVIPLSQGKLLAAESELYNLGIFDWASVGPRKQITTQQDEEALVKVHESKRNTITYGFGFEVSRRGGNVPTGTLAVPGLPTVGLGNAKIVPSENTFASPRGTIEFTRRNIRGLGETGSIALLMSRLDQRALATYIDPRFRRTHWRSMLTLSAERTTENPLFTGRMGAASWQLERTLDAEKTTTLQVRYRFEKTSLTDVLVPQIVLPEDQSVRLSTISGSLIHDTRDKPLDAHHGHYETLDLGITPGFLGSSAAFGRMLGQYAYYKPVHSVVWANSIRLGLAKAYGDSHVPTSERFFSGGGNTLRGFPINGAGPQRTVPVCSNPDNKTTCDLIRVPEGGRQLFILNSELRIPLSQIKDGLGVVLFYDGGNVYGPISIKRFVSDYTNTVGFGLRYNTPIGPVRFDIGHNLNPVTGIKATQFFITLGQAF